MPVSRRVLLELAGGVPRGEGDLNHVVRFCEGVRAATFTGEMAKFVAIEAQSLGTIGVFGVVVSTGAGAGCTEHHRTGVANAKRIDLHGFSTVVFPD
jgi:hypothetical protein